MDSEKKDFMIKTYRQFMEIGLGDGDPGELPKIVDEKITGFGTAIDEKILGIDQVKKLLDTQKAQSKGFQVSWRSTPFAQYTSADELTAVFADDLYLTIKAGEESIDMNLRFSVVLNYVDGRWKVVHWHGSKPEHVESEKDTWGLDVWKQKAEELERLVDIKTADLIQKNRELEIETALEKVRTVAMGMKAPEDMLSICQTIAQQLEGLGLEHIRNVQTAIFYPDRGTYMNYEYYARHNKTILTEVDYRNHPIQQAFATKMMQGPGEEVREHLSGQQMLDWHAFQKTTNQFVDDYILTAESLNYYWFSLGPVALGTSTYAKLTSQDIDLFKRFLKVFELAYQRYLDIEKALMQAREAKIEAALERVRARTMAMHKSDELTEVASLLFKQIRDLGIKAWTTGFNVWSEDNNAYVDYVTDPEGNFIEPYTVDTTQAPVLRAVREAKKKGQDFYVNFEEGEAIKETYRILMSFGQQGQYEKLLESGFQFPEKQYNHFAFGSTVSLLFVTYEPAPEAHDIFKRFCKVFEQTYTRFLDLQKAEAQAREAQIETSLERLRAHTMAMQSSSDVSEATVTMLSELARLGVEIFRCGIGICHEEEIEIWSFGSTGKGNDTGGGGRLPIKLHPILGNAYAAWLEKKEVYSSFFPGDEMKVFLSLINNRPGYNLTDPNIKFPDIWFQTYQFDDGGIFAYSLRPHDAKQQEILKRFAKVFSLTFRRFKDLKTAEAQAREASIEAALERVRSRGMGMQKSAELKEVIQVVYDQMIQLKLPIEHTGFILDYKTRNDYPSWIADHLGSPSHIVIPYFEATYYDRFNQAKREGETLFAVNLDFDEKNRFYQDLFKHLPGFPEESKAFIQQQPALTLSTVMLDDVALYIENFSGLPFSDEENNVLMRFGKVFQQTYTRFLDLQKAENQAREAEIQLALERVRARSLAMHHTSELQDVVNITAQQLHGIGMDINGGVFICINAEVDKELSIWASGGMADYVHKVVAPFLDKPIFTQIRDAISKGDSFLVENFSDEEKRAMFTHLFNYEPWKSLSKERKEALMSREGGFARSVVIGHHTSISITNHHGKSFTEEENGILKRFGKVFEQSYTRFLDLQKAEAQAREAQIEAALERVRARTMAMHNSQDVGESVATLFDELVGLGVLHPEERCGIGIMLPNHEMEAWTAAKNVDGKAELTIGLLDMTLHPLLASAYNGWLDKKQINQYILEGEDRRLYYEAMLSQPSYKITRDHYTGHDRVFHNDIYFQEGCLYVFAERDLPEESLTVYTRFAAVFGQTYRRYQDLRKAEAQAREAQIEAALESIRSKAMAMRNSEDIAETTAASFLELKKLGISSFRSGVGILSKASRVAIVFADTQTEDGETKALTTIRSMDEHPALQQQYSAWEKQEDYEQVLSGDELVSYYGHPFFQKSNIDLQNKNESTQECGYYFAFPDGLFYSWSHQPYSESEKGILRRFRNIISLTFRRYLDLQKAEAQAREAQIEAALERVRSRTMAMQSSDELADAAYVLFEQLNILGVAHERINIGIVNEDNQTIDFWITEQGGDKLNTRFSGRISEPTTLSKAYAAWKRGEKSLTIDLKGDELASWIRFVKEEIKIPFNNAYMHNRRVQTTGFFSKGMLVVTSAEPLQEEALYLLEKFAGVFDLTYTRFSDLQVAEAHAVQAEKDLVEIKIARQKAEEALNELKATQAQLVQQEKLASLGQLTAGIAHEIQNPLNFVNNFSEINAELSEEILEAAAKGDMEEVKALAADIKSNQEKIREHGKRADSIVKGMLQHSRSSSGAKEPTDLAALTDEYLRLSYHGMRAKDKSFNATIKTDFDPGLPLVPIVAQDIGRVLLNLFNNAFYAVQEKSKNAAPGYEPTVSVSVGFPEGDPGLRPKGHLPGENTTIHHPSSIIISVQDNGPGIPESIKEKIFQPFFTTKPTGQGTGLGLSLSYDIIKAHGGTMAVNSTEGEGTTFILRLPYSES